MTRVERDKERYTRNESKTVQFKFTHNVKEKKESKKNNEDNQKLVPANVNSKENVKPKGIFNDVRSMDTRLARLEDTFYNYAYDSTKILTSFHRNTKLIEQLINEITEKNEVSKTHSRNVQRQALNSSR